MELRLGVYRHYKGNHYQVMSFARHSETLEVLVVYQALYGNFEMWVRPLKMFVENIIFDAKEIPRFEFIYESFSKTHDFES